ncbi:MAG: hypothetical protein HY542_05225 [Deltaproteobacteria bacterium]|nr:hypothetical protein [Deltaproteobacteria bacterium]
MAFNPVAAIEEEILGLARARPFGLYWPRLRADIAPPSHTPVFRGSYLLFERDLYTRGDKGVLTRIWRVLKGGEINRSLLGPRDASPQFTALQGDRMRLSELYAGAWPRFLELRRGDSWDGVERAVGGLARYYDPRISLARLDLLHSAVTGRPLGAVYSHEGIRTLLDLGGGGPVDPVSFQRYIAGRSAVGSRLMGLVGSTLDPARAKIASLRSSALTDRDAEKILRQLISECEEDAKALGRLLWARRGESGLEPFIAANQVVVAERSAAGAARRALTGGLGLFPALKADPREMAAAVEPALALGAKASYECYAARAAASLCGPHRAGVFHSLFRQHLKKAGLLGLGALVFVMSDPCTALGG